MKKTHLLFALLISTSSFAQKIFTPKRTVGMNLPMMIDNTIELSYRSHFHRNLRLDVSIGGSPNTRGEFRNGRSSNTISVPPPLINNGFNSYVIEKTSGLYAKVGLSCVFGLPDIIYTGGEEGNFKFYVGPILGVSRFSQAGTVFKHEYARYSSDGTMLTKETITQTEENESGTAFGSGLAFGLVVADKRDLSCDIGLDILGYKRKSIFGQESHTIGFGTNVVIRVNYKLSSKK